MNEIDNQDPARLARLAQLRALVIEKSELFTVEELRRMMKGMSDTDSAPYQIQPLGMREYNDITVVYQAVASVIHTKSQPPVIIVPDPVIIRVATPNAGSEDHNHPIDAASAGHPRPLPESDLASGVKMLGLFGCFCSERTRDEVLVLVIADIKRLARTQRDHGRSNAFIRVLVWYHSLCCVISVLGDGSMRILRKYAPLLRLLGR